VSRASHALTLALLAALALPLARPREAHAINADPNPAEFTQPDGRRVTLFKRGDEWLNWQEDARGYPVVQQAGEWRYATRDAGGALVATPYAVGQADPAALGLDRGGPRLDAAALARRRAFEASMRPGTRPFVAPTGTVKNLVVLCLFSDQTVAANGRAVLAYDSLFNQVNSTGADAPTGSVRDFWKQASRGTLTIQSTVLAWVTLPHTQAYYANNLYGAPFAFSANGNTASPYPTNACGMVHDALALVDGVVNFADFDQDNDGYIDAIDFIHSGYGGEQNGNGSGTIWSHKYNLSGTNGGGVWTSADVNANNVNVKVDLYHTEPARWGTAGAALVRVGVIAHETGHFFGLPDLYDLDGSSAGIGNYCLMANSWGWDQSQQYPPLPSAWCRLQLGWDAPFLPTVGTVYIRNVEDNPDIARIDHWMGGNEYLLIENREQRGFDQQLPRGGLLVWHIDDNVGNNSNEGYPGQAGWPGNGNHYHVALLAADGRYDLEKNAGKGDGGDMWWKLPGIALSELTTPSTDSYAGSTFPTATEISAVSDSGAVMNFHYRPGNWVDFGFPGALHTGWYPLPYNSIASAVANTPDDGIVICKPSATSEHPTLTRPMIFKSYGGVATIGQ
jgi:M6 family metalloprotease-like protein